MRAAARRPPGRRWRGRFRERRRTWLQRISFTPDDLHSGGTNPAEGKEGDVKMPRIVTVCVFAMAVAVGALDRPHAAQCLDLSKDPAGCQPSTLDTPIGDMPSVRVNRQGRVDPFSSEEDARAGAAALEERLHLFRNFEHLHWVITVPSVKDPATGAWRGGDLDASGDGRGLGIAGNCIFVGHANGAGVRRAINIFRIQPNPERQPPVQVGEIPAMFEGNEGFDDRELRALVYRTSSGQDRFVLVRTAGP